MNRYLFTIIIVFCSCCSPFFTGASLVDPLAGEKPGKRAVDIVDFGARSWRWKNNAPYIQSAVDFVHDTGGGVVVIPSGLFLSGTIELKSNVELHLQEGAVLLGRPFLDDFPEIIPRPRNLLDSTTPRSLLYAFNAENIAVTGKGTIHGNGVVLGMQSDDVKPLGLRFIECRNVRVKDVILKYAASWMQLYQHCINVTVRNVTVYNHGNGRCDGLDIDACADVLVEGCDIDAYDDAVAVKSSGTRSAQDISVRNCTLRSMKRAIKIGTESLYGFKNISFEDMTIERCRRSIMNPFPGPAKLGILAGIADGGFASGLFFRNITMTGVQTPFSIIQSNMDRRRKKGGTMGVPGRVGDIVLENITAETSTAYPSVISGLSYEPIRDITLRNIDITSTGDAEGNPALFAGENADGKPKHHMYGEDLPASGLYLQHVEDFAISGFCVEHASDDPRPPVVRARGYARIAPPATSGDRPGARCVSTRVIRP